jgi:lantibiotic modifying enzyme
VSHPFLGFAHGSAGIGFALARLGRAAGDERYLAAAEEAADLLEAVAIEGRWPMLLGQSRIGLRGRNAEIGAQTWCHGAGGIARLFAELGRKEAARVAGDTVLAEAPARLRSGLCCGVAGAGNTLLDAYQQTGDRRYLDGAWASGWRLGPFAHPSRPGVSRLAADAPTWSPDLMQGYAGVGAFLLRLAAPESAPDLILGA